MAKNLFVGNLPYTMTDEELTSIFSAHGQVVSAKIISDKFSGRSKGFGFVEFDKDEEADAAIKALNGSDQQGRQIVVNEARPRPEGAGQSSGPAPAAPAASDDTANDAAPEAAPVEEAPAAEEAPAEEAPEAREE